MKFFRIAGERKNCSVRDSWSTAKRSDFQLDLIGRVLLGRVRYKSPFIALNKCSLINENQGREPRKRKGVRAVGRSL